MPRKYYVSQFTDIFPVFEAVRKAGGGRYSLPSAGAAKNWALRSNQFRKVLREAARDSQTPYDRFTIKVENCDVIYYIKQATGAFSPLDPSLIPDDYEAAGLPSPVNVDPIPEEDEIIRNLMQQVDK